jgi:hypothetical protein
MYTQPMISPVLALSTVQVNPRRPAKSRAWRSRSRRFSGRLISCGQLPPANPGVVRPSHPPSLPGRSRTPPAVARHGTAPSGQPRSLLTAMAPGEVVFRRLESAGQVAPVAAYAASVVPRTREDAGPLEAIGRALGSFAAENPWVQQISCPLLEAGAGGLREETSVEDLLRGFSATGRDDVLLRVFVLHDPVFGRLKTYFDIPVINEWDCGERPTRPIRVFVSYTRTDDAHAAWVKGTRYVLARERN